MFFWRILETSKANKSRIRWNKVRFFSIWFSFCYTRVGVILKKTFVTSLYHHFSDRRDKILKIDSWFYFPSAVKVCRRNSQKIVLIFSSPMNRWTERRDSDSWSFGHRGSNFRTKMVEKIREHYQKHQRNISSISDVSVSTAEPIKRDENAEIRCVLLCDR